MAGMKTDIETQMYHFWLGDLICTLCCNWQKYIVHYRNFVSRLAEFRNQYVDWAQTPLLWVELSWKGSNLILEFRRRKIAVLGL